MLRPHGSPEEETLQLEQGPQLWAGVWGVGGGVLASRSESVWSNNQMDLSALREGDRGHSSLPKQVSFSGWPVKFPTSVPNKCLMTTQL